ncbi:D-2-hydroxyacid dehydrogenase [Vibrio astriarenae]|nr:D-2-hydroxyacid dehydrogenase [Vibrio astriarenae]
MRIDPPMSNKLYILTEHDDVYRTLIQEKSLPQLDIVDDPTQANIVLGSPPMAQAQFEQFKQLEWLQAIYAGVDALCIKPLPERQYTLTNVKDIFGPQIAEYVLGYCIEHFRHFTLYHAQQQSKLWQPHLYQGLANKRMVILGCGSIASHLARTAKAFQLHTIGINSTGIPPKDSPFNDVFHISELHSALNQADIVVNTLPSTPETVEILNRNSLSQCQKALLFNVGRGSAINESDLVWAIENQYITHAYLDVFKQEPLDDDILWFHPKITVTPHIAALSFPYQVVEIFVENYQLWLDGYSLKFEVDLEKGY